MFYPYNTKEKTIFPIDLGDLIPEGAPARLIADIIDELDLTELISHYQNSKEGRKGYHPVMMLRVIIFGYMNNIFSLRGLEAAVQRDVHLIWLACYQKPDFSTISKFKKLCIPYIKDIFSNIVTILAQEGYVDLVKDLYIDGTTIRSRAARRSIRWRSNAERYGKMADDKIQQGVQELLEMIDEGMAYDQQELVNFTTDEARKIADKVSSKLGGKVKGMGAVTALREACDRKDTHDATLELCAGRCGVAPTDPECGIMHAKEDGYDGNATPNYNVQIATQNQIVTNYDVYDCPSDQDTAIDFIDTCIEENGVTPRAVIEDAGYGYEEVYVELEKRGIEAVVKFPNFDTIASRRPVPEGKYDKFGFHLSKDSSTLICPAGHQMDVIGVEERYTKRGFRSDSTILTCTHCQTCPFKTQCCVPKNKDCQIKRKLGNIRQEEKAKERLLLPQNMARLKRRSLEPEPVFGQIKYNRGYQRFRHFGKARVKMDLGFMLIAHNLHKVWKNSEKMA